MKSQTSKPSTEQVVMSVLADAADATTLEIAAAAKLGRSTVNRRLLTLESAGKVKRLGGTPHEGRRIPDRWRLASHTNVPRRRRASVERLRPGQLDGLVLDYMRKHVANMPLGPTTIANGLGRSSGAVANCLKRLAATGKVRLVDESPRRYA